MFFPKNSNNIKYISTEQSVFTKLDEFEIFLHFSLGILIKQLFYVQYKK